MNEMESEQEASKSNKDLQFATTTSNESQIKEEEFSKLTFRQKFAVNEYKYLLSPEDAEQVGKMLGNLGKEKDIRAFCQTHGTKVNAHETKWQPHSNKVGDIVIGFFGLTIFHNFWFLLSTWLDISSSTVSHIVLLTLPFLIVIGFVLFTKKLWIGAGSVIAILTSTVIGFFFGVPVFIAFLLPFPFSLIVLGQ